MTIGLTDEDLAHLRRCVELAEQARDAGDEPFGSVLVGVDGTVLAEDHNHVNTSADQTAHPEIALARWAEANIGDARARSACTVYTSGEHCPMCAAAHGWVGLGRIVYVHSSEQLTHWRTELGLPPSPVKPLPIQQVAPTVMVDGPVDELVGTMHDLHARYAERARQSRA